MQIIIDTKQDSSEDIKKAINLLNELIAGKKEPAEKSSASPSFDMFNMESKANKALDIPDEKPQLILY